MKIINSEKGVTLVEIVVVAFIIGLFSVIMISDFPRIQRQAALSRATYKLAQDLRKVEDMGLSGLQVTFNGGSQIIPAKGYGIYFDIACSPTKYIIYADVPDTHSFYNDKFDAMDDNNNCSYTKYQQCAGLGSSPKEDCIIDIIDISLENKSLSIGSFGNLPSGATKASIDFRPPIPSTIIANLVLTQNPIDISLKNTDSLVRIVSVSQSGLISVTK